MRLIHPKCAVLCGNAMAEALVTECATDVLIIGAGAAGLNAARLLAASGLRVDVCEARDRVGGRIDTRRDPDWPLPVERGAEFIHGRPPELLEIVGEAGIPIAEADLQSWQSAEGGPARRGGIWSDVEQVLRRLDRVRGADLAFAEFLEKHCADCDAESRAWATDYVEGFNAADKHIIGVQGLAASERDLEEIDGDVQFRVPGGYAQVIEWLAQEFQRRDGRLHLGCTVTLVEWEHGAVRVQVRTRDGSAQTWRAARLIVTVPLGVLQAPPGAEGAIEFRPPLDDKRAALAGLKMGSVVKLALCFDEAFWEQGERQGLGFLHALHEPFRTWWTTRPVPSPVLVGWAGGPAAEQLTELSRDAVVSLALDSLARLLETPRAELEARLRAAIVSDWRHDPLSRGAYSYAAKGGAEAATELARPLGGTLFFAGEATHPGFSGTVAGAISSGARVAGEVEAAVRGRAPSQA